MESRLPGSAGRRVIAIPVVGVSGVSPYTSAVIYTVVLESLESVYRSTIIYTAVLESLGSLSTGRL